MQQYIPGKIVSISVVLGFAGALTACSAPQGYAVAEAPHMHQDMMKKNMHMLEHGSHGDKHGMMQEAHEGSLAGKPGNPADVDTTVRIDLSDDMRFSEPVLNFRRGETVRFLITNVGQVHHEFTVGDAAAMQAHAAMMKRMPQMKHASENALSVDPGEEKELIWTFTQRGVFEAACHLPGHYEAGMKAVVNVI